MYLYFASYLIHSFTGCGIVGRELFFLQVLMAFFHCFGNITGEK
jgi:hypothetical protein